MKRILFVLIHLFLFTHAYAQKVVSNTEKKEYKIEEKIMVDFEVKSLVDSTSKFMEGNYKITSGPMKSKSTSSINGKTESTFKLSYEIKALNIGKVKIESPVFYINGEANKAPSIELSIIDDDLTSKEIDEMGYKEFLNSNYTANGTLRYVLNEKYGYLEEFQNVKWEFVRRMTSKEIAKLKVK